MIYSVIDNTFVRCQGCVYVGTSGTGSVEGFTEQIQGNVLTSAMKHKETKIHERFLQKQNVFFGYVLEERQQKKRKAKSMTDKKKLSDVKTKQNNVKNESSKTFYVKT